MSSVSFAALLCSRLCHDLVGPVGALANGVEILADEDSPEMRQQVLALLEQSARQTSNRLQFFRLAFGTGGSFGAEVDPREGEKALAAFLEGSKLGLDWSVGVSGLPKNAFKLLLNMALVASEAAIRGGELRVEVHAGSVETTMSVSVTGERLILPDATRAALTGQLREDALDPKTAPAFLANAVARELPATIEMNCAGPNTLTLTARLA